MGKPGASTYQGSCLDRGRSPSLRGSRVPQSCSSHRRIYVRASSQGLGLPGRKQRRNHERPRSCSCLRTDARGCRSDVPGEQSDHFVDGGGWWVEPLQCRGHNTSKLSPNIAGNCGWESAGCGGSGPIFTRKGSFSTVSKSRTKLETSQEGARTPLVDIVRLGGAPHDIVVVLISA